MIYRTLNSNIDLLFTDIGHAQGHYKTIFQCPFLGHGTVSDGHGGISAQTLARTYQGRKSESTQVPHVSEGEKRWKDKGDGMR